MATPEDRAAQRRFALRVFQHMLTAGVNDARYDPETFTIKHGDGCVVNLATSFHETRGLDGEDYDAAVEKFATTMVTAATLPTVESWEDVRPTLRPVLRSFSYLGQQAHGLRRYAFPFLEEAVVIDHPRLVRYPNADDLRTWGVTAEEAFAAARHNLLHQQLRTFKLDDLNEGSITHFQIEDNTYLASQLLIPGWLAMCVGESTRRPLIFIPDHSTMLITASPELESAETFEMAEKLYRAAAKPLSPQGYTLDDQGRVVPFDEVSPLPAAARARRVFAVDEYRQQPATRVDGTELHTARLTLVDKDDVTVALTTWTEGVATALPDADFLNLQPAGGKTLLVPFLTAVATLGLEPLPDQRPTRYLADRWPTAEMLARLVGGEPAAEPARADGGSWDEVRATLRPVLRPCSFPVDDGSPLIRRQAFPFIDELVAIDAPGTVTFPLASDLEKWGVSATEAFRVAKENLAAIVPAHELDPGRITRIMIDDTSYLTAWPLLPNWLADCTSSFPHGAVVFMPDQASLLIADAEPGAVAWLFEEMEKEYHHAENRLSPQGYALNGDGKVVPLNQIDSPPPGAARARAVLAVSEYAAQKERLEELQDSYDGSMPYYVAGAQVKEDPVAGPLTVAAWKDGVDYALPETDLLVLGSGAGIFEVPFAPAIDITGLELIPGLRPRRYRVRAFPHPEALARLDALASNRRPGVRAVPVRHPNAPTPRPRPPQGHTPPTSE